MLVPFAHLVAELVRNDGCVYDLSDAIADDIEYFCEQLPQAGLCEEEEVAVVVAFC